MRSPALVGALLCWPAFALAQAGAGQPLEVVVGGQRPGVANATVEKLDRTTLDQLGSTSIAEALERLPASVSASSLRGERLVSLWGFDQRQLLVTLDGVPVQVPYDGQMDLGKFPLGLVDHVTVVQGAGSLLFGPNGLGGVIDIATRRAGEGPTITASTETAPFYAQRTSGVASARQGALGLLGGLALENVRYFPLARGFEPTYDENGGRRDNSERKSLTAMAKTRWELGDHDEVVASAWHLGGQFGVPPGVHDLVRRFWRWSDWHVDSYALAHGYRDVGLAVDETLYVSQVGNTLDSYDDARYSSQRLPVSGTSTYDDRTLGGQARLAHDFACGKGGCATVRGWLGGKRDWHDARAGAGADRIDVDTTTLTAAAQVDGSWGPQLRWLAGTQIDAELPGRASTGEKPEPAAGVGPMGGLVWRPHRTLELGASAAERTRFPTLKERFSSAFGNLEPSPSLGPERATNLSLDLTLRPMHRLRVDASGFDSELRDLVIKVPLNAQTQQWQNAGRARLSGVGVSLRSRPVRWLRVWTGWAAMKARRLDQAPPDDVVPYRPDQKATVMVTLEPISRLAATVVGRYVGSQRFQNPDTLRWGRLGGYAELDARLSFMAAQGLWLWLRGTNLTDADAEGQYSFPEPGRQVFLGAASTWPDPSADAPPGGGP
jgi:iron complex outermembrane recepter protein